MEQASNESASSDARRQAAAPLITFFRCVSCSMHASMLCTLCVCLSCMVIRIDSGDTERARAPRPRARRVSRWQRGRSGRAPHKSAPQSRIAVRAAHLGVGAWHCRQPAFVGSITESVIEPAGRFSRLRLCRLTKISLFLTGLRIELVST